MATTQELTAVAGSPPSLIRRLRSILRSIVARIDLSHFPGSCCN